MKYHADGPAVMLGDSTSFFPAHLAAYWRTKGIEVVLITHGSNALTALADGTPVVQSREYETRMTRTVTARVMNPVLWRIERLMPRFKQRFERVTGVSADTELRLPYLAEYIAAAWPTMKAARAQHPRFVFGHEVTTYGLPTALCRGVPRIVFPWGGDVFTYAESSPFHLALTKFCLRSVDLIVPSSTTAAQHICERFKVSPAKVKAISWGVDRKKFRRADDEQRRVVCARWKIDPKATIVLNPRRFRPDWGAFVALDAFVQVALENVNTHFILFGGLHTEQFTEKARAEIAKRGLSARFTILDGEASLDTCAELMSISDVFVSLLGRGDMRSASVLQAAAAGAAPIVSDNDEYREMQRLGFAALFVKPNSIEQVLDALRAFIKDASAARRVAAQNDKYLAQHENHSTQMDRMLGLIDELCACYAASHETGLSDART